jgi:hypothetical protein
MNIVVNKIWIVGVALSTFARIGLCQSFVDLNFEAAQLIPMTDGPYINSIATSNALPGWTVLYGSTEQPVIAYNAPALGSTFVSLYATNGLQLAGNYSVLLQGGGTYSTATISQTGLVPVNSDSLTFIAVGNTTLGTSGLQVSIDGQDLSFFEISNELNYTVYGADVALYADQIETLSFSALEDQIGHNNWEIDDVQFSTSPIPEPSTLALCALSGLSLVWRWRKKSSARDSLGQFSLFLCFFLEAGIAIHRVS